MQMFASDLRQEAGVVNGASETTLVRWVGEEAAVHRGCFEEAEAL